jgi:DUF4097 and DUF4098 domain-containing protein YvlB
MRRGTVALGVVGVTLIAAGLTMAGCSVTSTDVASYDVTGDVSRLNVHDSDGTIAVSTGDGPVRVVETIRYTGRKPKASHTTDAGTLRLTSDGCAGHGGICDVNYEIRVPSATSVDVSGTAGLVKLNGLAGDLTVDTGAGAVEGSGLSSVHTTVRDEAGRISLRYAAAPLSVDVTAQAGAIEIRVPGDATYAVDARTSAGKTTVAVPLSSDSTRTISARNSAGTISIGT